MPVTPSLSPEEGLRPQGPADEVERLHRTLPGYTVGEEIGRGGYGVVFAGRDRLGRPVALKTLVMPDSTHEAASMRSRFRNEARVLAELEGHPHVVQVYDYVDEECILIMERLGGGSLSERFERDGFGMEAGVAVVLATCDALGYAHRHGKVHRDVKPTNILFTAEGCPKVADFGIAKIIGGPRDVLTTQGAVLGTLAYLAPEQAAPDLGPVDGRADVFATGVVLYELLSGLLPYPGQESLAQDLYRRVYGDPVPIVEANRSVPEPLAGVAMRALCRHPQDRFPTAREFGLAVAAAATTAWGPGWLDDYRASVDGAETRPAHEVLVHLPDEYSSITRRRTRTARVRRQPPTRRVAPPGERIEAPVPISDVLPRPPSPLLPAAAAVVLVAAALSLALGGLGSTRTPAPGIVVGGVELGREPVGVDFSDPVEVRISPAAGRARAATEVELGFSVGGIPLLPSSQEALQPVAGSLLGASLDATGNVRLAAGPVTGELRLRAGDRVLETHRFTVRPADVPLVTPPAVAGVIGLVLALGLSPRLLRALRRQSGASRLAALALGAGGWGALLSLLGWVADVRAPRAGELALCTLIAAGASGVVAERRSRTRQRAGARRDAG